MTFFTKLNKCLQSNIILVLTLQEEVGRLKDIVSVVRSSLADLDLYFKATNGTEEDYKKLYQNRFEEHDVIVQIRKLPSLLSDTVPELSKPLKYLILDTTKCNMTSIVEFEYFYANLISHAITLQFAYTEFANLNLDFVQEYWDTNLDQVQDTFDEMENLCVAKFEDSVSNEIVEDVSAEDLHKNNKERYNWLWNDVFEYQPAASYQLHFFKRLPAVEAEEFFYWNGGTGDFNRIIVFGDKNTTVPRWDKIAVQNQLWANASMLQEAAKGPNAAKDLGQAVGTFINNIDFIYKCIVVFYDDQLPHIKVLIDNSLSTAACVSINASEKGGNYRACVYPEIWNDFASYLNAYTEIEIDQDSVSAAALSVPGIWSMLPMAITAAFMLAHIEENIQ